MEIKWQIQSFNTLPTLAFVSRWLKVCVWVCCIN